MEQLTIMHMGDVQLIHGDCLDPFLMAEEGSVDMILFDPPYGTSGCKWDSVIPFEPLWERLNKLIKGNGAILMFGTEPFSSKARISNIQNFKYDWIWKKNKVTGFAHSRNMPLRDYESISVFSKAPMGHRSLLGDRRMEYYPQGLVKIDKKTIVRRKTSGASFLKRPSHKDYVVREYTGYPRMILEFDKEEGYHPTQKPVALLEYLIKTYTKPGDTVLDCCMGSGSTGVACVNTGRKFIGIEKDRDIFFVAEKRIEEACMALNKG